MTKASGQLHGDLQAMQVVPSDGQSSEACSMCLNGLLFGEYAVHSRDLADKDYLAKLFQGACEELKGKLPSALTHQHSYIAMANVSVRMQMR